MISREEDACAFEPEHCMIRGVARRQDCSDRPTVAFNDAVVGEENVRGEVGVRAGVEWIDLADMECAGRAMWSFGTNQRAGASLQCLGQR